MAREKPKKNNLKLEDGTQDPPKTKKKKKVRLEDDSQDPPKKKKKKKVRLEDDTQDPPKKKKKKKKKTSSKDSASGKSATKKWLIRGLILLALVGGIYQMRLSSQAKDIAKTYMISLAALNKLQVSCTALWSEVGIDKKCDQDLGEKAIGKYLKDVKLTIIESRSHRFTAQVQHKKGDKVFQVNKKGDLFLNTNGCLSPLRVMNPDIELVNKMANSCKTPAS
ncbi:MAG: hypothetical protein HN474_08385 [Nitrospina sp.]|nr:hypothetical protein [Nitrospina sp.]